MSDLVALVLAVIGFAVLATAHVAVVQGLAMRSPRWHAIVAFFVPPLAPIYALGARLYVRAALWLIAAIAYAIGLFFVRR